MNHPDPIDWEKALATVGGDPDLLNELFSVYIAEARQMVSQMKTALAASDRQLLRRSAHTLKGASMSMAATTTTAESELLEQGCEGMDESALAEHLARVEVAVEQAIEAIENRMSAGN
ncbi:Hpt domain protein [Rubripirellula obstinata]|uniref:Hpt domain protein n=1 Tax=Rubripirellula obstinata TaxID=406547 RepID=A0A5B1CI59_9BACT|nr:Hpt domain-containing protein [Rubripirellula obstinata]KAA1259635.1 Hpt domain protein [Rubripirellula obstinata]